jgi:hypothetical protein
VNVSDMRLALALGVVGAALAAAPAQAAVVAVTDSGLRDAETRIFTGQRVSFTNLTGAAVTIDSTGQPDFDDLTLPAGDEGERRFRRAGRYRYRAAGRDGVIIVQAFARAPRPRPNGDCGGGRKIYRYDIVVKGRKSVMETWLPQYRNDGAFSISYNYLANYPDVLLDVTDVCGGGKNLDLPAGRAETAPGTGSLSGYTWSDNVHSADSGRPPGCGFTVAASRLGTQVAINGFLSPGSGGGAAIASRLTTPQFNVLDSIIATKHSAVCDKDPGLSNAQVFDGLPGYDASADAIFTREFRVRGGLLHPPNISLFGDFAGFTKRGRPAEIGRKLAQGRSFSVATTKTFDDTSSQTVAHGTASISISLRRR